MIGRRALIAALAGAPVLAPGAGLLRQAAAAPAAAGAVLALTGEAEALAAAGRRLLAPEASVFVNDVVMTGVASRLSLRLAPATVLQLGAEARLVIDQSLVGGGTVGLSGGALIVDKPPGQPRAPVTVRSPFGLVAVRGTRVFMGPSRNGAGEHVFGVFVFHGRVDVMAGGQTVPLTDGQGTEIARPGAPPVAVGTWGPARIARAEAQVTGPN